MDERVDIVDEQGSVLYQTTKGEAHEKGLLHMCVVSEVINSEGKWVLVKQASDRQDAGQYVSPIGGHVQAGESLEDALRREAMEEMGLSDISFEKVGQAIFDRTTRGKRENHYFMMYKIKSDATPSLNHESVGYEYFTPDELKKQLTENPSKFGDAFRFVVDHFFPELKP